jgi:hypothetical protein
MARCKKCGETLRVKKTIIKRFSGIRKYGPIEERGKVWRKRYKLVDYSCYSEKCNNHIGEKLRNTGFRVRGEPVCEHEFEEMGGTPMFEHRYICKKCGYFYTTDSSG